MHGQNPRLRRGAFGCCAGRLRVCLLLFGMMAVALIGCTPQASSVRDSTTVSDVGKAASVPTHTWTPDMFVPESPQNAAQLAHALSPAQQRLTSWMELAPALHGCLTYAASREPEQVAVAHGNIAVTWGEVAHTLLRLQTLLPRLDKEPELFASAFRWLRLSEGATFSGYYEPVFKASRIRRPGYTFPLYRLPPDLKQMDLGLFKTEYIGQRLPYRLDKGVPVPYYTRAEIDGTPAAPGKAAQPGVLHGKGLELAWLADPLDAYFLHVQGSGRLRFSDGSEAPVRFAGTNGRPYLSIGKYLSGIGSIPSDAVSMQAIRQWLNEHPNERDQVLYRNSRYVFFRTLPGTQGAATAPDAGPVGSMGLPIVPWVTLAVDRQTFPLGAVLAFDVQLPVSSTSTAMPVSPLRGLGLAQDSGEAIRERRVDLFCGRGEDAAYIAGHLNTLGDVWLLLAK